jgi:hypothetical protein
MKTLKRILEQNNIIAFDILDTALIGAVKDDNAIIPLDGDTSNVMGGTPVIRETEFTVSGDTLSIAGLEFNTLLVKELKQEIPGQEIPNVERITPAQGMYQLSELGFLSTVEQMINASNDEKLKIFWSRSVFWNKSSNIIQNMANSLGIDINEFFYEASLIEI